jgi:hypothetical protein
MTMKAKQGQCRRMHGVPDLIQVDDLGRQQHNRPEQRHPGAIQLQEGQTAEEESEIDQEEDEDDERGQDSGPDRLSVAWGRWIDAMDGCEQMAFNDFAAKFEAAFKLMIERVIFSEADQEPCLSFNVSRIAWSECTQETMRHRMSM